jgi:hypothetical protein
VIGQRGAGSAQREGGDGASQQPRRQGTGGRECGDAGTSQQRGHGHTGGVDRGDALRCDGASTGVPLGVSQQPRYRPVAIQSSDLQRRVAVVE